MAGGRTAVEMDAERRDAKPWRKWYSTARWRALRLAVLARDGWKCRQTGVLLSGVPYAPDSAVADHIVPHRGDPALFWDIDNLQAVAKEWHDGRKQRQDRASR